MLRPLFVVVGLLEAAFPDRLVARAERWAFENPDDARLRPWTIPMARLEGLAFAWIGLRDGVQPESVARLLGPLGVLMCLFPRQILAFALASAYENPEEIEPKPWVGPVTRGIGACYVVLALFSRRAGEPRADESSRAG
ncbi:hypothetical protein [Natronobeatus ordinarius]|uniref:hypothetical protein n=1 Tax=Natronobeatus ordinarius TaxID=2963433 RepID=UPI0020CC1CBB|nr:hypothetical protein [Natronobeatus ordinarius]